MDWMDTRQWGPVKCCSYREMPSISCLCVRVCVYRGVDVRSAFLLFERTVFRTSRRKQRSVLAQSCSPPILGDILIRPAHPPLPSLGIPSDIQHSHPLLQAWPERRGRACARVQITKEDKPPEAARLVTPPSSIRWGTEIKLLHPPPPRTRSFPSSKNSGC